MTGKAGVERDERYQNYVSKLAEQVGRANRSGQLGDYCAGLLMPLERKSVEPIAAVTEPARCAAKHQSLLHFVGQSPWSDTAVLRVVRDEVLPVIERRGGAIHAWLIDDTSFPKKGEHSVGVKRQYCGQLGKTANCQVAVTLSIANEAASLPIAYRLFLPEDWAGDKERRAKAGVPEAVAFQTKPEIALDQIRQALADGVPEGVVLADSAYGNNLDWRSQLNGLGLRYCVGILPSTTVWPPGKGPLPPVNPVPKPKGRPHTRLRRDDNNKPVSAKALAETLGPDQWQTVTWREGTNAPLTSRFAAVRVRPARRDNERTEPHAIEWLLVEWPDGEDEPTKYWFSNIPETISLKDIVNTAKGRWRIERDYQDLKQELGLGHYEGRGWRGFHHHATLAIAAYGFLILEADALSPSGSVAGRNGGLLRNAPRIEREKPTLPKSYKPRGAAAAA